MAIVSGTIAFADNTPGFTGGTMYVRLIKTMMADEPSEIVSEYVRPNISYDPKFTDALYFELKYERVDPSVRYSVSVHIDRDMDGKISKGDFITMQSYPVLTFGYPSKVSVLVKQVK